MNFEILRFGKEKAIVKRKAFPFLKIEFSTFMIFRGA
jgi:hypothetical protein